MTTIAKPKKEIYNIVGIIIPLAFAFFEDFELKTFLIFTIAVALAFALTYGTIYLIKKRHMKTKTSDISKVENKIKIYLPLDFQTEIKNIFVRRLPEYIEEMLKLNNNIKILSEQTINKFIKITNDEMQSECQKTLDKIELINGFFYSVCFNIVHMIKNTHVSNKIDFRVHTRTIRHFTNHGYKYGKHTAVHYSEGFRENPLPYDDELSILNLNNTMINKSHTIRRSLINSANDTLGEEGTNINGGTKYEAADYLTYSLYQFVDSVKRPIITFGISVKKHNHKYLLQMLNFLKFEMVITDNISKMIEAKPEIKTFVEDNYKNFVSNP